jgi:hypothetical protein
MLIVGATTGGRLVTSIRNLSTRTVIIVKFADC